MIASAGTRVLLALGNETERDGTTRQENVIGHKQRRIGSMNPLRTTVLMKTDISGSTSRFRQLLAADLQALLGEHRDFLSRHAGNHEGHIIKGAGHGHSLQFAGLTPAAAA